MKKISALLTTACVILFAAVAAHGQGPGGFTGPGSDQNRFRAVKVSEAKKLPENTRVVLQGNILRAAGGEKYLFGDGTAEIKIDINDKTWKGLSVSEKDKVEISGKVEVKKKNDNARVIDVKSIKKL
jgi:uncharacterized protein (TIGR00156 family)